MGPITLQVLRTLQSLLWRQHRFPCTFQPLAIKLAFKLAPIDLTHAGIDRRQHSLCAGHAPGTLRHGLQRGNPEHRQFGAERQPLGNTNADTHTGKAPWATAKGQGIEL
ncbi:hypothetical protein D3C80_1525150 [compost metagenome]